MIFGIQRNTFVFPGVDHRCCNLRHLPVLGQLFGQQEQIRVREVKYSWVKC